MEQLDNSSTSLSNSSTPIQSSVESVVGEIFYSKDSNLLDTIRFYQVTRMVTDTQVIIRELHQMNIYGDTLNYSCPIVNWFISEEKEVNLCNKTIFEAGNLMGKHLKFSYLKICEDVSIKVWDYITHHPI